MALFTVIKFDGLKNRDWMIYKYPSESLTMGSQLVVQEGQVAIFCKNGAICDVFYPGTHTLSTGNLPILNNLVNIPFGGRTPFNAEIYYVNSVCKLDINWGTIDPIQLIDPKYHVKLRVRAFGQMGLKVNDCVELFKNLIGGMQLSEIIKFDKVKEYYRGIIVMKIKSAVADTIITKQISALEISTKLEDLSQWVKEQIEPQFVDFGFNVANFFVQSVNFPDEDFEKINKILEDKAAFEIMGDSHYATKRAFDVYEGAANNENGVAGAFAAGGIGLGAAMNMGMGMNNVMGNPLMQQQPQQQQPPQQNMNQYAAQSSQNMVDGNASQSPEKKCPSCNSIISEKMKFCPECGYSFEPKKCECGAELAPNAKFCFECGRKVD